MGRTADERLTRIEIRSLAEQPFGWASSDLDEIEKLEEEANTMAQEEHMSLEEAIRILTGQTKLPYGSPKR